MESENSQPSRSQIIDINVDVPEGASGLNTSKICAGSTCGLSDSATRSKDAKERNASMQKLLIAVVLCIIFMAVEVVGGIKANSLAIITDAAHLLSDVAAFAISLFSLWVSGWEATPRQSYGYYRIEILGAMASILIIWALTGVLVKEAIGRLIHPTGEVQGVLMFAVAAFGLVVNIVMAILLGHDHGHGHGHGHGHDHGHGHGHADHDHDHHEDDDHSDDDHAHGHTHDIRITTHPHHSEDDKHKDESSHPLLNKPKKKKRNINVHSAYIHVLGDSIQSVGVMIGGAIIWYKPELKVIDLICTLIFSVLVLVTTFKMMRDVLEILMESTPREIDTTRLEKGLCKLDGVVAIHELHIWAITIGKVLLACHVTIAPDADADLVLDKVIGYIREEYNISHVTIQIERQQIQHA
uniref:Metal tolerance protein 1-like n=1 Tax=Ananas comosus var. bracteatus TaxID=296719 RepID=A0A6V7NGE2_ANACO|nr:unnamed protein product [Ananas comosus var. bracteatus]